MKVAPVSADLLIKLALGAAVIGAAWYGLKKAKGAIDNQFAWIRDSITAIETTAGQVERGIGLNFTQPVADRADPYTPSNKPAEGYGGKYDNPLVNDAGMNFGLF